MEVAPGNPHRGELVIDGFHNNLEVTTETKLLEMIVTGDLKWSSNTEYVCKRAHRKMWIWEK